MLYGLRLWIWADDHGYPHIHVYKGTPSDFEAMLKLRIDTWEVLSVSGFNGPTVNRPVKFLKSYENVLLTEWRKLHEE